MVDRIQPIKVAGWAAITALALLARFATVALSAEAPIGIVKGQTEKGISYMFGGIGSEERELMKKEGKDYNLRLAFAQKTGQYVADVGLVIEDAKRTQILSITVSGPWFFIKLPEGTYNVKATYAGKTREIKNLKLEKDRQVSRTLVWEPEKGG